jgi:hypothetical protein
MWQRGIALYYSRQYEKAARQFRQDVAVNGNDTEEALWAFLAEAQLNGADVARTQMLKVEPFNECCKCSRNIGHSHSGLGKCAAYFSYAAMASMHHCDKRCSSVVQVGRDPRGVMRVAQMAFEGEGPSKLIAIAEQDTSTSRSSAFYALLYVALLNEAEGRQRDSHSAMCKALATPYAQRASDYMVSVARVHIKQRNWPCAP